MTAATAIALENARGATNMTAWESELASFMNDLSSTQNETLELLVQKQKCLAKLDAEGLAAIAGREEELMNRLQECLRRRAELLEKADQQGLPASSIGALAKSLPSGGRGELGGQVKQANSRTRLLRHQSLTNWVVVQRTLLHLSQMLEIIATGGKKRPTYSKEDSSDGGGALVDSVA
jgi:flagellar biosynthesis/type III secretory pathway chaperone